MKLEYNLRIIKEKASFKPRSEFTSQIVDSDKRIFEITAQNGYGKTFILNLIAYALAGDKLGNEYILRTLKDRIARYDDPDSYELDYNISFELPDGKNLILSKKADGDRIIQFEGEAPMGATNLHKKVTLLYDVPIDPSERLNSVIKDLGIWNNSLENKIKEKWAYLRQIEKEFISVRDEEKILQLIERQEDFEKKIEDKVSKLESENQKLNKVQTLIDLESLRKSLYSKDTIEIELNNLTKQFKKLKKPEKINKKDENKIRQLENQYTNLCDLFTSEMSNLILSISNNEKIMDLINDDNSLSLSFEKIKTAKISDFVESEEFIIKTSKFNQYLNSLSTRVSEFIRKEENGKAYIIDSFLKQLLEQIDELISNKADDLIEELTKFKSIDLKKQIEIRINSNKIYNYKELKSKLQKLPIELHELIKNSRKVRQAIQEESSKTGMDEDVELYYRKKSQIEGHKDKIKELTYQVTNLIEKCSVNLKVPKEKLFTKEMVSVISSSVKSNFEHGEVSDSLTETHNNLKRSCNSIKIQLEDLKINQGINKASLDREEAKKESLYSAENQEKIKRVIKLLGIVNQNIDSFSSVIHNMDNGNLENFSDDEDLKFIKVAGSIIAFSMDNKILRPNGEYIGLDYFDLIKKEFHCGDIIIMKDDISTGLASANYLKQRINNVKGEYVAVLLDEIGNMDPNTLKDVISSIKKLEDDNRLIIALLTQPIKEGIKINPH